jgi:hypothetical protein
MSSLLICQACERSRECQLYPCEVDYRSNGTIPCSTRISLCDSCFDPDKVFTCKEHVSVIQQVYCDYTNESYWESPVFYDYPEKGFRRVRNKRCRLCKDCYDVCSWHDDEPKKYRLCAYCFYTEKIRTKQGFNKRLPSWLVEHKRYKDSIKGTGESIDLKDYQIEERPLEQEDSEGFILVKKRR